MTTPEPYFFDSYAFLEILHANPSYSGYTSSKIVVTKLNLFEIYNACLRYYGKEYADDCVTKISPFAVDFDLEVIKKAAVMRATLRERRLSMTDVIGYVVAAKQGLKFLTGDRQFEDLPNVEFVK